MSAVAPAFSCAPQISKLPEVKVERSCRIATLALLLPLPVTTAPFCAVAANVPRVVETVVVMAPAAASTSAGDKVPAAPG